LRVFNSPDAKVLRDRAQQSPQLPRIDTIGGHQGADDWIVQHLVDGGFGTLRHGTSPQLEVVVPLSRFLLSPVGMKIEAQNSSSIHQP
jgi:hypothetical protein